MIKNLYFLARDLLACQTLKIYAFEDVIRNDN